MPLHELTDRVTALELFDQRLAVAIAAQFESGRVSALVGQPARLSASLAETRVNAARARLRRGHRVGAIALDLGVSERQLERLFLDGTGLTLRMYRRILRARRAIMAAGRGASRSAGATIVLVRTIIAPDAHSRSTLQWPEFMRAGVAPGAPGTTFDACLSRQPGDIEVVKQRYSAFVGTQLDEILKDRGIVSVIVLGLTTNVCVQSPARDAWQRDYQTITLADCCAEVGEGSHQASLAWTSRNFGTVSQAEEVLNRWRRQPSEH